MSAKLLAERARLLAALVVQVPLRRAVVDPHAGWVSAVTRRRVAVANHRDVTALDERGPRLV